MPTVEDMGMAGLEVAINALDVAPMVAVGIQGGDAVEPKVTKNANGELVEDEDALTVVEIAALHEYGLGVPRRSFIADTFDVHGPQIQEISKAAAKRVLSGEMTAKQALDIMGAYHQSQIKKRITEDRVPPPNSDATIKRKGSDTPLVNTGQQISAITWALEGAA